MKTLLMGTKGVGKTRTIIKLIPILKGRTIFFSELPEDSIKKIAGLFGVGLSDVKIVCSRPSLDEILLANNRYDNIIIDHWLRIKSIYSRKIQDTIFDMLEQSDRNWFIIAHTLKGLDATQMTIDSGKYTSGLDAVIDLGFGIRKVYGEELVFPVLKDRYYLAQGKWVIDYEELQELYKRCL